VADKPAEEFDIIKHGSVLKEMNSPSNQLEEAQFAYSPTKKFKMEFQPSSEYPLTTAQEAVNSVLKKANSSNKGQSPFEQFLSNLVMNNSA